MQVLVWVREGVWEAAIDAALAVAAPDSTFTLVHVMPTDAEAVVSAGLFGRGRRPPARFDDSALRADEELLSAARNRLGRPAELVSRHGRTEREVVQVADGADLLVVSRDGDRRRLGPHSLGPATRFVVDHAPCPVLLVWPESAPAVSSIPPPPSGHQPPPAPPSVRNPG